MTERKLTATDAALRDRITGLSVHVPCGGLRGPVHGRWQSCPDEDSPEKWEGCDVSREYELCIICFRATAGGSSRWALLVCDDCRAVNMAHMIGTCASRRAANPPQKAPSPRRVSPRG
jgi:hypothetical protein